MRSRTELVRVLLTGLTVVLTGIVVSGGVASPRVAHTALTFQADLEGAYPVKACPDGTPVSVECFARSGTGVIPGLGTVQEAFAYFVENSPAGCDDNQVRVLPATAHLSVAGKGEIEIRLPGTGCLTRTPPLPLRADEAFTITGGSGKYAGATGAGRLSHLSYGPPSFRSKDTWTGTLNVPGLNFDVAPPTVSGATDKVVRAPKNAKRVRVSFSVTALDEVDGRVAVSCRPKSGSKFKLGRTPVTCSAGDTSGNTQAASFVVTVKHTKP